MKKRVRKQLTVEELAKRYKKRYHVVLCILVVFVVLTGLYLYLNYDYLAFKHFIASSYIYTETLDKIYEKHLGADVKGGYFSNFDNVIISIATKEIRSENGDRYTYMYTPQQLTASLEYDRQEAAGSEVKSLNDSTIYLKLTNYTKHTLKFMEENLEALQSRPSIIIDLQGNRGGDIKVMVNISSMFLPKNMVIATDHMRWFDYVYRSNRNQPLKYDKIIILQDNNTASASENMIAALKDNLDNVELIGSRTFGKGIGQFTLPLRRGYAVKATILKWFTPDGINIHGAGIDPDIEYTGDDIIQYALNRIG